MSGSKIISKTKLAQVRASGDFVWDGQDDDDRPLSKDEMLTGVYADQKKRGRPLGSTKESTTIRFDRDVLEAFRAYGAGWQTRMNAALREWLKTHPSAA